MRPPSAIIPAKIYDCSAIMTIFKDCTREMLANGIGQWHYDYPRQEGVAKDIQRKEVFVWQEDLVIMGTITLNEQQDQQYQQINWQFPADKILVVHRLAVSPKAQGRKIGFKLCQFAEEYAKKNGYDAIRLDAYAGNPGSNYLYEKLGYHLADGQCRFHNNEFHFNCWEKKLE